MYSEEYVQVSKADDNSFIITSRKKREPKKGTDGKNEVMAVDSDEKISTAQNEKELMTKLKEAMSDVGIIKKDTAKEEYKKGYESD